MKTQYRLSTRLTQTTAFLVLALASLILISPGTRADVLHQYQPQALIQAEQALEQGNPERALVLLHRQRAIISHDKFRAQGQSIACQAYVQKQDLLEAQQACDEAVAYAGDNSIARAGRPVIDPGH